MPKNLSSKGVRWATTLAGALLLLLAVGAASAHPADTSSQSAPQALISTDAQGQSAAQPLNPDCTVTIQGSITISDPTQNGRLATLLSASSCGPIRACPGVFDTLARQYKSYTFVNNNTGPTCVTVSLTPACLGGIQIQSAAYLGSYDPSNLCANYLGDIGPIPNLLGGSYSFTVPAGATYVVVVNDFLPLALCTNFTLTVSSDPNCPVPAGTASPTPNTGATQTAISATQTAAAGSATATATTTACTVTTQGSITISDPTQNGRLATLLSASSCGTTRNCPGVFDTLARQYKSYTYVNSSSGPACITVSLTPACLGGIQIQSAAYLGSYDPSNLCANYLGDIGPIPNLLGGSYSFTVPAGATYVVVVNDFLPAALCTNFTLSVTSDQNCPVPVTATPTPNTGATQTAISATQTAAAGSATATATTTACTVTTQGSITISDPLQAGRLITLVSASSCGTTRNCPGTFDTLNRHYKSYTYQNGGSTPACVTVNLTPACAGGLLIQSAAYLGSFDPSNLCANYLGDIGPIPNLLGGSYSFTVPAGATYVVVVNELVPGLGCSGFTLSVTSDQNCPVPGTATPTPGGGTQTAIAGTATAAASETSVSGTATAAASETSVSGTATAAASETSISATQTAAASQTSVSATLTAAASRTAGAGTPTPTANGATQTAISATQTAISNCTINFSDVHQTDYFYTPVLYLFCHGVISGYSDGTFRPYNNTTRSQMVKIVVLGFNKAITTPAGGSYTFTDVPRSNNFFSLIETAAALNIVSGYNCGTAPAGPCDAQNRPWFLPYNNVTRGQLSKIDVIAAGWTQINPAMGHFSDVPHGYVFYTVIETAYCHGALGGYSDGTFRPSNNATRGQIAKIVYLSIVNPPTNCSGGAAAP